MRADGYRDVGPLPIKAAILVEIIRTWGISTDNRPLNSASGGKPMVLSATGSLEAFSGLIARLILVLREGELIPRESYLSPYCSSEGSRGCAGM